MADAATLQAQASALIDQLHLLEVSRGQALAAGDTADAANLEVAIGNVGQQYNGLVAQLAQIEGPSSTMLYLDHVGDVVISGVGAGASAALNAIDAAGKAAGNLVGGTLWAAIKPLIPLFLVVGVVLVVVVIAAGKSGAVKLTKVGI